MTGGKLNSFAVSSAGRVACLPGGVLAGQLRVACRDVSAAAAVLAGVFGLTSGTVATGDLHAATYLVLFPTGLLLARYHPTPRQQWPALNPRASPST